MDGSTSAPAISFRGGRLTQQALKARISVAPAISTPKGSQLHRLGQNSANLSAKRRPVLFNRIYSLRVMLLTYLLLFSIVAYVVGVVKRGPAFVSRLSVDAEASLKDLNLPGVDANRLRHVPILANRFNSPWYLPPRTRHRSLKQSRNRVLYSSIRERAGDGIGHAFGTMNAEVNVAFRLGLAYTHRVATYGSITRNDDMVVENLFGWGNGEIPRTFIRETFCSSWYDGKPSSCQVCEAVKKNESYPDIAFNAVVEIPDNLTFTRGWCGMPKSAACQDYLHGYLQRNNDPNTIFQMPLERCDRSPVDTYIDQIARGFFFHKYWDHHGSDRRFSKKRPTERDGLPRLGISKRRKKLPFREDELVVTMHARRGDFFHVKREMISIQTFGRILRQVMRVVQKEGGIFAELPVSVNVYSEGTKKHGVKNMGHDIALMTKQFVDSDGKVRDEEWIKHELRNGSDTEEVREGIKSTAEELFRNGLKVKLHVATDTIMALHEMISSDVFIGSHSALGKHIVSSLSRGGVHFMPYSLASYEEECCHASFDGKSGDVEDYEKVHRFWKAYAAANKKSASRAFYAGHFGRALGMRRRKEGALKKVIKKEKE